MTATRWDTAMPLGESGPINASGMFWSMETHVLTFTITKSFAEWVATYDASLPLQKIAGITSLYRGVSKDDPSKVCEIGRAHV